METLFCKLFSGGSAEILSEIRGRFFWHLPLSLIDVLVNGYLQESIVCILLGINQALFLIDPKERRLRLPTHQ